MAGCGRVNRLHESDTSPGTLRMPLTVRFRPVSGLPDALLPPPASVLPLFGAKSGFLAGHLRDRC